MLTQEQYDEFARDLDALAEPVADIFPEITALPWNMPDCGRPGIVLSARLPVMAKYPYPISILIRWRDAAVKEYLEADAGARKDLQATFQGHLPAILRNIEQGYGGVDWHGRSQASSRGIVVELDEF
jgi:hypothetical protein